MVGEFWLGEQSPTCLVVSEEIPAVQGKLAAQVGNECLK